MMAEHGTYLVPTIIASRSMLELPEGMVPPFIRYKAELASARHREVFALALKEGVKFAFGTDAGTTGNEHGRQTREFGYMVEYGMTPMQALVSATITAAELMRTDKQVGSIEAGKLADIVAFDADPLENIDVMNSVSFVMKGGVVYKQDGQELFSLLA